MGEHVQQQIIDRSRIARKHPAKQPPELTGRRLLQIVVYGKRCRIGGTLTLDDLAVTSEIGDWKMPDFKAACAFAVSQGWPIVEDDTLTLTTAGLAAASASARLSDRFSSPRRHRLPILVVPHARGEAAGRSGWKARTPQMTATDPSTRPTDRGCNRVPLGDAGMARAGWPAKHAPAKAGEGRGPAIHIL